MSDRKRTTMRFTEQTEREVDVLQDIISKELGGAYVSMTTVIAAAVHELYIAKNGEADHDNRE